MLFRSNADFWDNKMGDGSNYFHLNLVRPNTEKLLDVREGDHVLDIACGNGNFSQRLAELGAKVTAFDFSPKLIEHAKRRRTNVHDKVTFLICDAVDHEKLDKLKKYGPYDKAVSNMAIMDISDIRPLFAALKDLLVDGGFFVFSTHHPCFTNPKDKYLTECIHKGEAIKGQPVMQNYYHRPLQNILNTAFENGFVLDAFCEVSDDEPEIPVLVDRKSVV